MKDDPNSSKGEYVILIENEPEIKKENDISLEAMIVDEMINKNCSIKEAINNINKNTDNISKKDIYNASLNLKDILKR